MPSSSPLLFSCSVDDGHPSDMKAFDLLQRHGINATFYVPIRNREGARVLVRPDLLELARHFEIGSHTHDHCYLRQLDPAVARYQIDEGKKKLEDVLGRPVTGFCYPGGKYTDAHVAMVQRAGFDYARSTMNLCFDAGRRRFEIPTTLQFYPHSRAVFLRNFVRGGAWTKRSAGLRLALQHEDWIARLYALFDHANKQGGVFHLWGHSKDIDELNAWRQLEQFLTYVAARVAGSHRLTNAQLAARTIAAPGSVAN